MNKSNLSTDNVIMQDPLPVVPPGCLSDRPDTIEDFIMQAKAALVSVNIFKDDGLGNHCFPLSNIRLNI